MSYDLITNHLFVVGAVTVILGGIFLNSVWPLINRNKKWQAEVDARFSKIEINMDHRFNAVEEKQASRDKRMSSLDRRDEMFTKKIDEIISCIHEIKTNQAVMHEQIAALSQKIEKLNG